jgi:hypothetical protein
MRYFRHLLLFAVGLLAGIAGTNYFASSPRQALAFNDRHEDHVMCTGSVTLGPNFVADGIWLLDYRAGKLLGTVVDRNFGKVLPWAEADLVQEFNIAPKQNVHFMMTTGTTLSGQTPLYITEVNTGRFAVYTMMARADGRPGVIIRKHDATVWRPQAP